MEKGFLNSPTDANSISMANTNAAGSNGRNNMPLYTGGYNPMPHQPCNCGGPKAIQPPPMNNRQQPSVMPPVQQYPYPQPANTPRPYRPTPKL